MKRAAVVLIVIAAALALGYYWTRPKPVVVQVKVVERGTVESTVTNTRAGTVNACRRARLAPAIGGQVARMPVREGDRVKKDALLLELWNDDLRARLLLARREAAASAARAEEACVAADVAEREARRLTQLLEKKLASEESADRAVGESSARRAACKAAEVTTEVSAAQVRVAEAALDRTRLTAPFDGTVAEVNVELGEYATPSPIGVPTLPAVDLIDSDCLYVTAPMDEVDAPTVRAGMTARIVLDAFPGRHFPATVRRVAPYVLDREKQARTVDVEVEFVEASDTRDLLPGYSADAEVVLAVKDDVVRVPTEAVQEGGRIWVLDASDILESRRIEAGISNWVYTEIVSGLLEGERVVTSVDREGLAVGAAAVADAESSSR